MYGIASVRNRSWNLYNVKQTKKQRDCTILYPQGCYDKLEDTVKNKAGAVLGVLIAAAVFQVNFSKIIKLFSLSSSAYTGLEIGLN